MAEGDGARPYPRTARECAERLLGETWTEVFDNGVYGTHAIDDGTELIERYVDAEVAERVGACIKDFEMWRVDALEKFKAKPAGSADKRYWAGRNDSYVWVLDGLRAALATAGAPGSQEDDFGAWCAQRREWLGRIVREVWVRWAKEQPEPKPSWLVPWDGLTEPEQEVDRRIGEAVAENALWTYHRIEGAKK